MAKEPPSKTKQSEVNLSTAEESIFEEGNTQGASKPRSSVDNKNFLLFCLPVLSEECKDLCRKYIGQGSTVCILKDCKIVHRGDKNMMDMVPQQLFVQKTKGTIFSEPMLDTVVDPKLLSTWKLAQHTLSEWVELFEVTKGASVQDIITQENFEVKSQFTQKSKNYKTPSKKQICDSLENNKPWMFKGFPSESTNEQKLRRSETDLYKNQKEHSHLWACQVDLEESITNVSHTLEYAKESLTLRIGKKPKHLSNWYEGPDVYLKLGLLATEVVELPHTMTSNINSEKANVLVDLQNFQSKMEQDLKNMRSEFTELFQQMKKYFTLAISNLKQELDNQELAQTFGSTVTTSQV